MYREHKDLFTPEQWEDTDFRTFFLAYLESEIWLANLSERPEYEGMDIDENIHYFDQQSLERLRRDALKFYYDHFVNSTLDGTQFGHEFAKARNGHETSLGVLYPHALTYGDTNLYWDNETKTLGADLI